jgi:diguanylate cyclase (GGDEF)-like protein/PAS domain S-box-containing protein
MWIPDVLADPRVLRKDLALETGLRGALFLPIVHAGKVLGVLDFTCRELRPPDERLRQAFQVIGAQIGQFLERARAEEQMRRFRLAMDESADMIVLIDRATMRFVDVNDTVCRVLGYSREELLRMGPQDVLPLGRADLERAYDQFIADPSQLSGMKSYYRCKDGTLLPFESTRRVLRSGQRWIIVAISRDTSERIAAEEALRESEARFRSLTQMSSDFFWETDDVHRFTLFVPGSGAPAARPVDELLGKTPWELPSLKPDQAGWEAHKAKLEGHLPFRDFEIARPVSGGAVRYLSVSGEPRFGADGTFVGYRGVGRDVTEIALARERIVSLAYSDPLTGLANRTSLAPALEQALERARRRKAMLAGLYIDLDGFKPVNDSFGHDAGDRVLVELAGRLRSHLRASDPVARLGGDEFFVVLEEPADREALEIVAHKLLAEIARPLHPAPGHEATLTASIGISVFPDDADDADALMKHADTAMYEAKQCGKNCLRFFGAPVPSAQSG